MTNRMHDSKEWLEIFPYGMSVSPDGSRPILIFKDKSEKQVLPVWLSPLDAGLAMQTSPNSKLTHTPHELSYKILNTLGVKLTKCLFVDIKGQHQFVELHFEGSDLLKKIKVRADDAMSYCLGVKPEFYCTKEHIKKCREMDMKIQESTHMGAARTELTLNEDHRKYMN